MIYDNTSVRRQDRLLDEPQARALLQSGEYGVLSLIDTEGRPYGIPVNYVWDGQDRIYLHCAPEGKKLNAIRRQAEASFCVVGCTHVVSHKFTTGYESIVMKCRAQIGLSVDERRHALRLLLEKYSPHDLEVGLKYAEKSFHRTEIIRLDIREYSGKQKKVD